MVVNWPVWENNLQEKKEWGNKKCVHWHEIMQDEILKSMIKDLRKMDKEGIWKTSMLYKTVDTLWHGEQ